MYAATKKIAPKVIKLATPWYIRWIYSICGDEVQKMATAQVAPADNPGNASDSIVGGIRFFSPHQMEFCFNGGIQ